MRAHRRQCGGRLPAWGGWRGAASSVEILQTATGKDFGNPAPPPNPGRFGCCPDGKQTSRRRFCCPAGSPRCESPVRAGIVRAALPRFLLCPSRRFAAVRPCPDGTVQSLVWSMSRARLRQKWSAVPKAPCRAGKRPSVRRLCPRPYCRWPRLSRCRRGDTGFRWRQSPHKFPRPNFPPVPPAICRAGPG